MLNKKFIDAAQSASIGEITSLISDDEYAGNLAFMLPLTQTIIVIYFIDNTMCRLIFDKEPLVESGKTRVKVVLGEYPPIKKTRAFAFEKLLVDLANIDDSGYIKGVTDTVIRFLHKLNIIKISTSKNNAFFFKFSDDSLFCGLLDGTKSFIFPDCPLDIEDTEQLIDFVQTQNIEE